MRKTIYFLLILLMVTKVTEAIDSMPEPFAPYGLFDVFSAETLSERESAHSLKMERSIEPDYYRFIVQYALGITDKIEFSILFPYVISDPVDGIDDISIDLKYRFLNEGRHGPSVTSIFYITPPSGKESLTSEGKFGTGVFITKKVGPVTGHLNVIYTKPSTARLKDEIVLSGGFDFRASHAFDIIGEIYSRKPYTGDSFDLIEGRFGYRLRTTESIYTTVGIGTDFKMRTPEYRIFFAVTFISGRKELEEGFIDIIKEAE